MMTIGVISDTHGLMRPEALEALQGCGLILHAGDVGKVEVLERLRAIAPTIAVRGNVDWGDWGDALAMTEATDAEGLRLYMLHVLQDLDLDPRVAGFAAVISGHTHRASAEVRDGVLYLNPGSAGPRRFSLPVTIARLHLANGQLSHEIVHLRV